MFFIISLLYENILGKTYQYCTMDWVDVKITEQILSVLLSKDGVPE
jgi:hypothetical protein